MEGAIVSLGFSYGLFHRHKKRFVPPRDLLFVHHQAKRFKQIVRFFNIQHIPTLQTLSVATIYVAFDVHVALATRAPFQTKHSSIPLDSPHCHYLSSKDWMQERRFKILECCIMGIRYRAYKAL